MPWFCKYWLNITIISIIDINFNDFVSYDNDLEVYKDITYVDNILASITNNVQHSSDEQVLHECTKHHISTCMMMNFFSSR